MCEEFKAGLLFLKNSPHRSQRNKHPWGCFIIFWLNFREWCAHNVLTAETEEEIRNELYISISKNTQIFAQMIIPLKWNLPRYTELRMQRRGKSFSWMCFEDFLELILIVNCYFKNSQNTAGLFIGVWIYFFLAKIRILLKIPGIRQLFILISNFSKIYLHQQGILHLIILTI